MKIDYQALSIITFLLISNVSLATSCHKEISRLENICGVATKEITSTTQLPASIVFAIKNNEINVQLTPPTDKQYSHYLGILKKALEKYPVDILRKHLNQINIGGRYQKNGGVVVGLYDKKNIYLFYNHPDGDNSDTFLEQSFHHELSSIFIYAYDFPAFEWLELNPQEFSYIINPTKIDQYMDSIESYQASPEQLKQGLVSSYGMANAENDINSYVELIFTRPKKMRILIDKYPIINTKYNMIKSFYISISPDFNVVFSAIK